jgi:hypothetical protein
LLLISADFLASDYCYDRELSRAMERHGAGEAVVVPAMFPRPGGWSSRAALQRYLEVSEEERVGAIAPL